MAFLDVGKGRQKNGLFFPDVIKAVSMSVTVDCPLIDSVYVFDASTPSPLITEDIPEQLLHSHGLTSKDWRKAQLEDPTLSVIVCCLETGLPAPLKPNVDPSFDGRYLKEWDKLPLSHRVLHRKVVLNGQHPYNSSFRQFSAKTFLQPCMTTLGTKDVIGPCHW